MTDDYSNYPKSITEAKADKTGSARDWTVRDALIHALRLVDSGEFQANRCAIVLAIVKDDGVCETQSIFKSDTYFERIGILEEAKK